MTFLMIKCNMDNKNSLRVFIVHITFNSINGITFFLPDDVICNITICADDTTLYSKCDYASDLWQQLELASELISDLRDAEDWSRKWLVEKLKKPCLTSLRTLVLLMWKWMGLFLGKNNLLRRWG